VPSTTEQTEPVGIPFNGTLGVNFHPTERIYFQLASHMVASFDKIPEAFYDAEAFFFRNPQDESQGTLRSDHSVPGYTLWDIRVGVQVSEKASVTIGIDNLFDKKYFSYGIINSFSCTTPSCVYPEAGRTVFANAEFRLQ